MPYVSTNDFQIDTHNFLNRLMYNTIPLIEDIFWVGLNDRHTDLFENLWPLPKGVSYNAYLVRDEKTALIDTVEVSRGNDLLLKIKSLLKEGQAIDYLVINHIEPDHSGAIKDIIREFPDITIVGNKRTFQILAGLYGITENLLAVKHKDELPLGRRTLQFAITPWVHWPETMMTYVAGEGILFSGDAFGSFGALDGGIFDNEISMEHYNNEILRYFTNVMGSYAGMAAKALKKIEHLDIKTLAPTHGPIWRNRVQQMLDDYERWGTYQAEKGVVILFGTMYGNTEKMADVIARRLVEKGVHNVKVINSARVHFSDILTELWRYKGVIMGSCAYNSGVFPAMGDILNKLSHIKLKNRLLGVFGSFSWNGGGVKSLQNFAEQTDWQLIAEPVETKGQPATESFNQCIAMADKMAEALENEQA